VAMVTIACFLIHVKILFLQRLGKKFSIVFSWGSALETTYGFAAY
jgi:hypothetical protein